MHWVDAPDVGKSDSSSIVQRHAWYASGDYVKVMEQPAGDGNVDDIVADWKAYYESRTDVSLRSAEVAVAPDGSRVGVMTELFTEPTYRVVRREWMAMSADHLVVVQVELAPEVFDRHAAHMDPFGESLRAP